MNNLIQSCNFKVGLVGGACADVMQSFHRASKYEKKDKFISILNEDGRNAKERTLVFVETKRQADFLCLNLCEEVFTLLILEMKCFVLSLAPAGISSHQYSRRQTAE